MESKSENTVSLHGEMISEILKNSSISDLLRARLVHSSFFRISNEILNHRYLYLESNGRDIVLFNVEEHDASSCTLKKVVLTQPGYIFAYCRLSRGHLVSFAGNNIYWWDIEAQVSKSLDQAAITHQINQLTGKTYVAYFPDIMLKINPTSFVTIQDGRWIFIWDNLMIKQEIKTVGHSLIRPSLPDRHSFAVINEQTLLAIAAVDATACALVGWSIKDGRKLHEIKIPSINALLVHKDKLIGYDETSICVFDLKNNYRMIKEDALGDGQFFIHSLLPLPNGGLVAEMRDRATDTESFFIKFDGNFLRKEELQQPQLPEGSNKEFLFAMPDNQVFLAYFSENKYKGLDIEHYNVQNRNVAC